MRIFPAKDTEGATETSRQPDLHFVTLVFFMGGLSLSSRLQKVGDSFTMRVQLAAN